MSLAFATQKSSDVAYQHKANIRSSYKNSNNQRISNIKGTSTFSFIQRKPVCPCDGGCPSCVSDDRYSKANTSDVNLQSLRVSKPSDPFEQEADRVSKQVILSGGGSGLILSDKNSSNNHIPSVQLNERNHAKKNREFFEENEKSISEKAEIESPSLDAHLKCGHTNGSNSLPGPLLDFFSPRFGFDFSQVHIHNDANAKTLAHELNAQAFTLGNDIFFGTGYYQPHTTDGKLLIAHELAHIVQQQKSHTPMSSQGNKFSNIAYNHHHQLNHVQKRITNQEAGRNSLVLNTISNGSARLPNTIWRRIESLTDDTTQTQASNKTEDSVEIIAHEILTNALLDPEDLSGQIRYRMSQLDRHSHEVVLAQVRSRLSVAEFEHFSSLLGRDVSSKKEKQMTAADDKLKSSKSDTILPSSSLSSSSQEGTTVPPISAQPVQLFDNIKSRKTISSKKSSAESHSSLRQSNQRNKSTSASMHSFNTPQTLLMTSRTRGPEVKMTTTTSSSESAIKDQQISRMHHLNQEGVENLQVQPDGILMTGLEPAEREKASSSPLQLTDLVQPVQEDFVSESSVISDEGISTKLGESPGTGMEAMNEFGREPSTTKAEEDLDYNMQQQAAMTEVKNIVANLITSKGDSGQRIQSQAQKMQSNVRSITGSELKQVQRQVAHTVSTLRKNFAFRRSLIRALLTSAHDQVSTQLEARQSEVKTEGTNAKNTITELFDKNYTELENIIQKNEDRASELYPNSTSEAGIRIRSQADKARQKGRIKAKSFPGTSRGIIQADAAEAVAESIYWKISESQLEVNDAIGQIISDIPDGQIKRDIPETIRYKGNEALNSLVDGKPKVLLKIDEEVQVANNALNEQARQADQQLDITGSQIFNQLKSLETAALSRAESMELQAKAYLQANRQAARNEIQVTTSSATTRISVFIDQAIEILLGTDSPDVNSSWEFCHQTQKFAMDGSDAAISMLQQTDSQITQGFQGVSQMSLSGLQKIEKLADTGWKSLEKKTSEALFGFVEDDVDEKFGSIVSLLHTSFVDEIQTPTKETLEKASQDLNTEFGQTVDQAKNKIDEAVHAGLSKNDEALIMLDEKMNEAASKAAYDFDHPVLSSLRYGASFAAGVIVGILAVIATIVIVIVAFKLLIAALVFVGLTLAAAKLVALVVGIGVFVVLAYSAYNQRVSAGESGGLGTLFNVALDLTGISDITAAFNQPDLSPFERGFKFGKGVATLASFWVLRGKRMENINKAIDARLPGSITNPTRGGLWKGLGRRFGWKWPERVFGGTPPAQEATAIAGLGKRPAPSERAMTREQWRAQNRAERIARSPELSAGFNGIQIRELPRLLGKRLTSSTIDVLGNIWRQVAKKGQNAILTKSNSRSLFNNHRNRFWRAVRRDPTARSMFEDAGAVFEGRNTSAPVVRLSNGRKIVLTIDHFVERQTNPGLALDPSNLQIVFELENTVLLRLLHHYAPFW